MILPGHSDKPGARSNMAHHENTTREDWWFVDKIEIPSLPGAPPINIAECFAIDPDVFDHKDPRSKYYYDGKVIKLPPEAHPPKWEVNKQIADMICKAGLLSGSKLSADSSEKGETARRLTPYRFIRCSCGRCCKNPTGDLGDAKHKANVKKDRFVNKDAAIRGETKGAGKKEPRRTVTTLPTKKEHRCNFQIKLMLKKDQHWYIPYREVKFGVHNHMKPAEDDNETTRMKLVSDQIQQMAAKCSACAAGGATQNIIKDHSGIYLSQSQLKSNREKQAVLNDDMPFGAVDSDSPPAQRLIALLDKLSAEKHLRYIALFHRVTQSNLPTIKLRKRQQMQLPVWPQKTWMLIKKVKQSSPPLT